MQICPCGRPFAQHPLDPHHYSLCPVCRNKVPWDKAGKGVTWGATKKPMHSRTAKAIQASGQDCG